jgi:hypothetical protein
LEEDATPEAIEQAWTNIVEAKTGRAADLSNPEIQRELSLSIEQMPTMKGWIKYFYRIASSDWPSRRRSTFHFLAAVKWSNIERELSVINDDFKQKNLSELVMEFNQEVANG